MTPQASDAPNRPALLHEALTRQVIAGFHQVHNELGFGFAESVYKAAMECVLVEAGVSVSREMPIAVHFHGRQIASFKADLVVESAVLVEIKAMRRPDTSFEAQVLNYLRATPIEVGLLLYFNPAPIKKRLIFTNDRKLPR